MTEVGDLKLLEEKVGAKKEKAVDSVRFSLVSSHVISQENFIPLSGT